MSITRAEFQALEQRVAALETPRCGEWNCGGYWIEAFGANGNVVHRYRVCTMPDCIHTPRALNVG